MAAELGLGDRVVFAGRVHYLEAHRYLRLGDVAVAPKVSATEGSGKLPNYMAMALSTVAFDTPVSRDYLGEWGTYAEAPEHRALAKAIASLLEEREFANKCGVQLRERAVRLYSTTTFREEVDRIYSLALEQARPYTDSAIE